MQPTHLLAVDPDKAMDDELASLAHAAGEQGAIDGCVKATFERVVGHVHIRRHGRSAQLFLAVGASSTASSLLRAIIAGEVAVVHANNGGQAAAKLALPLLLADVLAVVGASGRLGSPFLLEIGARGSIGRLELRKSVQRPTRPVLADVLRGGERLKPGKLTREKGGLPAS